MRRTLASLALFLAILLFAACGDGGSSTHSPSEGGTPPVILSGPAPRVVPLGASWTFTVNATGSGLAYQWRKGGQPLSGATSAAYAFTAATLSDGGSLDVIVSNASGTVTSAVVDVKVVNSQGPWNQDLKLCVGADPDHFGSPANFLAQAGVVSLVRRANSQLIAVFQWFPFADPAAFDLVAASTSTDGGRSWTSPKIIQFTGLPAGYQRPFDPTVTLREDGSLRLYFTCSPSGPNPVNGFCSATSTDGQNFTVDPGQRFYPGRSTVDCAVIRWNGLWHLTSPIGAPQEGAYHAVSADGLAFTRVADIPSVNGVNWTGNLVAVGSALRFYGSPGPGLWYTFTPDGTTWSAPVGLGFQGGDPAVVEAESGRWLMVYTGPPGN